MKTSQERARELIRQWRGYDHEPTDMLLRLQNDLLAQRIAAAIDEAAAAERDEIAAELALAKLGTEENYVSGYVTHYYRCDVSNWIKARGKVG
jgi:hypothetical protein